MGQIRKTIIIPDWTLSLYPQSRFIPSITELTSPVTRLFYAHPGPQSLCSLQAVQNVGV